MTLTVPAKNFAAGPPFIVTNNWRPRPVTIYATVPDGARVIAAPLPMRGGMRITVYNDEEVPITVTLESAV